METVEKNRSSQMDFALFAAILLLCAFGLVMVFSSSYYYAQSKFSDGLYYLRSQSTFLAAGVIALLVISRIDYHLWDHLRLPFLVATMVMMAAVVVWGVERNGAKRWLDIFGIVSFQPSELAKFALVLYMSAFMARFPERMKSFVNGTVPMLVIVGIMCLLVLLQKNMSMMVIVLFTGILMLYVGGVPMKHLLLMGVCAVPILFLVAYMEEYRMMRLKIFMDPWQDELGAGYQLIQSLYAFGSGGLFGQGLNFSRQKLLFLTYGESDFIFAIIGEELGLIGCAAVILAYAFITYRGIMIALKCKDRFGSLLAAGITSVIAMQAAVNIGVATSSIPTTGQTLPFVSAGGTSLFIFLCASGILLNISKNMEET
ncbi:MAG: putative lipid II flippase FtsW [Eubacteriales bacterium]|nr:putative lipid II flippase FtsW [Eubacteriales bacterium]